LKKYKNAVAFSRLSCDSQKHSYPFQVLYTSNPDSEIQAFREEFPSGKLLILSDSQHAFEDMATARRVRAGIVIDGEIVESSISSSAYHRLRMNFAGDEAQLHDAIQAYALHLISQVPSKFGFESAKVKLVEPLKCFYGLESESSKALLAFFDAQWRAKVGAAIRYICVSPHNDVVERVITDASEAISMLESVPGIYVIVAPMGWGKTSRLVLPIFRIFSEQGSRPILAVPRRAHLYRHRKDQEYYENWWARAGASDTGLMTVTNSLFRSGLFREIKEHTRAFLVDEYELVRSHHIGPAIGSGGFLERAAINAAEEALIKRISLSRNGTVVFVDALMSDETVYHIAQVSEQKVFLVQPDLPAHHGDLYFYSSRKQLAGRVCELLGEGKNVAVITDMGHRKVTVDKLAAFHSSCSKFCKGEALLLDADKFSDLTVSGQLEDLDSTLERYQLVTMSPVLSSAVSLTTTHFDAVFVISAGAILLNELLQCFRRFRSVPDIHLSLPTIVRRQPRSEIQLLYAELAHMPTFGSPGLTSVDEVRQVPGVQSLLSRSAFEERMRSDYANNVLIMAEHLGYKVIRRGSSVVETVGSIELSRAQIEITQSNAEKVAVARRIAANEAALLRKGAVARTEESRFELAAFDLRNIYGDRVSSELVMDDSNGKLREWIAAFKGLSGDIPASAPQAFKLKIRILEKLCECLRLDPLETKFSDMQNYAASNIGFCHIDAKKFRSWLEHDSMLWAGERLQCKIAFEIAFPRRLKIPKSPITLAQVLLREELGFKTGRSSKRVIIDSKQYWIYGVICSDLQCKYEKYFYI
jgi:hypothetical protein